jgi:hypothetical protein
MVVYGKRLYLQASFPLDQAGQLDLIIEPIGPAWFRLPDFFSAGADEIGEGRRNYGAFTQRNP